MGGLMAEAIGVDLGGTKMLVGVVDEGRRVLYRSTASSHGLARDDLLDTLEREVSAARSAHPAATAVGLGIPCTIDRAAGRAILAVNLDLADIPIRDLMAERVGIPVFLDNDANLAALAEHRFGAGRGTRNMVMLTVGTGIGGGLILNGEPYRGSTGAAAELGHTVIELDGPECQGNCPNHGCVEVLASGTAIAREGLAIAEEDPDSALGRALSDDASLEGREVTEAAQAGDERARGVLALVGKRLGAALSSFANIFNPDLIVIGGGVVAAGELLIGPAREELASRALPPMNETPVAAAELGPEAGMIGAATMAFAELEASE